MGIPPHRAFRFDGYPIDGDDYYAPELSIYPRNAEADNELSITSLTIEILHASIGADLMTYFNLPESHAPTTIAYFTFKGGTGDRGIEYPIPRPPPGEFRPVEPIFGYRFFGLTDDGAYYIDGYFPLDVTLTMPDFPLIPTLPGTVPEAGTQYDVEKGNPLMRDYLSQIFTRLVAVTPDGYTPRLALLDAMMRSIEITGKIELQLEGS